MKTKKPTTYEAPPSHNPLQRPRLAGKALSPVTIVLAILFSLVGALAGCQSAPPSVGDPAPSFTLPSYDGSQVSLSQLAGKRDVLLYFHMGYG